MVWRSLSSSCHSFAVCFTSGILAYSIALSNSRVFPACSDPVVVETILPPVYGYDQKATVCFTIDGKEYPYKYISI